MANEKSKENELFDRLGSITRNLHDNINSSLVDKVIERVANEAPDTKERLKYIARITEEAAQKVLNAVDEAGPIHDSNLEKLKALKEKHYASQKKRMSRAQKDAMFQQTLEVINHAEQASIQTKAILLQIMMSQDFQDLTGQVIKKITGIIQETESELLKVLVDFSPVKKKEEGLLNGPQIDPKNANDVVADQGAVDDLLESLGF